VRRDRLRLFGQPGVGGHSRHGSVGQGPDVGPDGHVGQRRQRRLALLDPDGAEDQEPRADQVSGKVVQQLDRGQTGVVQIVQHQQRRPVGRQQRG
jgi:hypothetical protein